MRAEIKAKVSILFLSNCMSLWPLPVHFGNLSRHIHGKYSFTFGQKIGLGVIYSKGTQVNNWLVEAQRTAMQNKPPSPVCGDVTLTPNSISILDFFVREMELQRTFSLRPKTHP